MNLKTEKDKYIIIVILVLFLVIIFLIPSGNRDKETGAEVKTPVSDQMPGETEYVKELENETLSLSYDDGDGSIIIEGEGPLSADDLQRLMIDNSVGKDDVENAVVGDGITEIGYNTFNGYYYLNTLKLGRSVTKIRNGAVTSCGNLKFVYMPSGIERIALDFLLDCPGCCLVSDGSITDRLSYISTSNAVIAEDVLSYDDLADALYGSAEPAMEFGSDALNTVDGELAGERVSGEYPLILKPGYIQYGPYCRMEKGDYHILIKGAGLDSLWNDCIYVNINEYDGDLTVSDARINERSICYDLTLSEGASNVEFCITDYSENEVKIKSIQVYNRIFIPETVKKWW